jgi:hypothetical protein
LDNLVKLVLDKGGSIHPLVINDPKTKGTGLCNPSIYIDDNNDIIVNIRNVGYLLYHCEGEQKYESRWGPLTYMHPENDMTLRTTNFLCKLDTNYNIKNYIQVDTTKLDSTPVWTFIGLEDARLVKWYNKLYLCGVRRDTKPNGEGRMELSHIEYTFDDKCITCGNVKELTRKRIEPPNNKDSYCEKNWMPILDMPYHFVKWVNVTEVVKVDPETNSSKTIVLKDKYIHGIRDIRGGSQVVKWNNYRVCITHEVDFIRSELGKKNGKYYHRIVVWDNDWNIVYLSEPFHFLTGRIEFCCGLAIHNDNLLITFGFQDNAAFLLRMPITILEQFINGK